MVRLRCGDKRIKLVGWEIVFSNKIIYLEQLA